MYSEVITIEQCDGYGGTGATVIFYFQTYNNIIHVYVIYVYVHSKIGNRSFGRGKNESNFEKNIHLRKRLFFYYWIFKCTLFLVVCVPVFPLFSFATHLTFSPTHH